MTETRLAIALLTPVPLEHLEDGVDVCRTQGKVAYGSRDWETFRQLDELRQGHPVEVFIYASPDHSDGPPRVGWHARYVGHVDSVNGAHPAGMTYRPPSTARDTSDNQGHWAVFWEAEALTPLPTEEQRPVHTFSGWQHRKPYAKSFVPRGPLIVDHPGRSLLKR